MTVPSRAAVAITGPSGTGKSTFLRVLTGLQRADSGTLTISSGEYDLTSTGTRPGVALIHQDYRLVPFLTAAQNVELAQELHSHHAHDATHYLEIVGLGGLATRSPAALSGGEQQRVAIARALACGSKILLADEPTGALDEDNSRSIATLLATLGDEQDATVVVATHDPIVFGVLPQRFELKSGQLETRTS
jgi:ABC-type lipoprotein export system ATPase subunit